MLFLGVFLLMLGFAPFGLYMIKIRKSNYSVFGILYVADRLKIILSLEFFWLITWFFLNCIFKNGILLIFIPLVFLLVTIISTSFSFFKDKILQQKLSKRPKSIIKPILNEWEEKLPDHYSIKDIDSFLRMNNNVINGRLIINVTGYSTKQVQWKYYGEELIKKINQPLITEIRVNNETVYPLY